MSTPYRPKNDPKFHVVYNRNRQRFTTDTADSYDEALAKVKAVKHARGREVKGFYIEVWKRVAVRKGSDDNE